MGFSSWLTADTRESIAVSWAAHPNSGRTVYLLQPDADPIAQPGYDGYAEFGGVNAHIWLARTNARLMGKEIYMQEEQVRTLGIMLDCGDILEDKHGGLFSIGWDLRPFLNATVLGLDYGRPIVSHGFGGKSANELVAEGTLRPVPVKTLVAPPAPLKFSFNRHADYHALPPSEHCPHQGYFYN